MGCPVVDPPPGRDHGILAFDAPARYAASKWTPGALAAYFFTGKSPPPIPSVTGVVEPAEADKIGIACSGGGVRSAAFGLGALQVLQEREVLRKARYLAGVSGGAYIAASFAMVRKTWVGQKRPAQGQAGFDDSDPGRVNDRYPPFFPGSPEEQYLRNRSSYMAPGLLGKLQLVYRVLLGMALNLLFIALAVAALSAPLSLLYGLIYSPLRAHLEHGGLCRAPLHAGIATRLVTCEFTPLSIPGWLWIALAIMAGSALILGAASILAYKWPQVLADFTETWSLRLLMIGGSLGVLLIGVPILLSLVRGWGAATELHSKHLDVTGAVHAQGSGGKSTPASGVAVVGAGGAVTLGAAVLLQIRGQWTQAKALASEVGSAKKWYEALTPRIRLGLAYLIASVVGPALTLAVALATMTITLNLAHPWERLVVGAGVPIGFIAAYLLVDITTWSLHSFYRRRLCSAFALKRVAAEDERAPIASERDGRPSFAAGVAVERDYTDLVELSHTAIDGVEGKPPEWPTLLVCAAANISDSAATPPGRAVTSFTFSPTAMGGPLVGAVSTRDLEDSCDDVRKRYFTLPAAVAVSGAAISPSMGKMTRGPLRFLMALANVRLGLWVPNPRRLEKEMDEDDGMGRLLAKLPTRFPRPRASYLFRELLGINSINARYLYVTDGGHYENLGLVELLRRGCTEVYVFDASNDDFGALGDAVALARSELDVEIDIDYSELEVDPEKKRAETDCVSATITYSGAGAPSGTLYYSRLVMPPGAPADVVAYQGQDPRFPHDPTTDQLYTDQRFEAYRSLGAMAARTALLKREIAARAVGSKLKLGTQKLMH